MRLPTFCTHQMSAPFKEGMRRYTIYGPCGAVQSATSKSTSLRTTQVGACSVAETVSDHWISVLHSLQGTEKEKRLPEADTSIPAALDVTS